MSGSNGNGADKPSSGAEFRKRRRVSEVVTLPSGLRVRVGLVALDVLIRSGQLPDILTPSAAKTLWATAGLGTPINAANANKEDMDLIHWVVAASLLEPHYVEQPQGDDQVGPDDLDFADKYAIFMLATQPVEVLRSFRLGQERSVETVPDEQGDVQPA
jgi:hypothetical protein